MATETMSLGEQIKRVREKTGAGMMDCKRAITESKGDFDKAVEALRKKRLASAAKKASRTTKEGLVGAALNADGTVGAIVELNCETDFVAKTDEFIKLVSDLARQAMEEKIKTPQDADSQVKAVLAKLGENMSLKRFERFALEGSGLVTYYVHSSGSKKGSLIELSAENDAAAKSDAASELAKELGMQIVAMSPKWLSKDDVPKETVAKEREIFETLVRKEGKPEAAVPKIVEGKINKLFFQQWCLLEQVSMRDNKTKLAKLIDEASVKAGGKLAVKRFARYQLGGE